MKVKEKKWIRVRITIVAVFFVCGLSIILARAYQLQVLERREVGVVAAIARHRHVEELDRPGDAA